MIINVVRRTMRSYCGHGCAIRGAGEVRASAPIRVLVAVIAALLAVQFMPVAAYADSIDAQIISGPSAVPFADMYGASIAAPDRYTAAAILLGHSPEDISSWDDDTRAKLSNEQTGGRFYYFAENSVQNYFDATEHTGIFKTFLDYVGGTFWNIAQSLYGNNLWAALYTSDEYAAAASDLSSILAGENIGGGGSGGGSGDADTITWDTLVLDEKQGDVYNSGNWYPISSYTVTAHLDSTLRTAINSDLNTYKHYFVYLDFHNGNSTKYTATIMLANVDTSQLYFDPTPSSSQLGSLRCPSSGNLRYKEYYARTGSSYDITVNHNAKTIDIYFPDGARTYSSTTSASVWNLGNGHGFALSRGVTTPVVPPTNWPDEPSAPSPPDLPEPGTNPTVTPTPWAPVISPTFDFDLNITTEPTTNDLIDWVKKIYYELRNFHSDAQDWFDEVGKGIESLVDAIDDAEEQIYGELQTIDETVRDEGQKIRDYMYQMFHWLKDQLDFQNNSFDDNNIVYWLKRIWSKLGNGDINLRPTDPTNDPDDWWDWLVKAIQNFLIGLAATSTELISEIADLASQVMHEFPFSIPWDIAAVLAALSTAPVTPVFTVTVPAISGWWNTFDFVIDLHPFDGAAETIRLMEKLLFTGLLIWKSKELLEFMDVTKWFD